MASVDLHHVSPETFLAPAKKEGRGLFKVYLGVAPGVGKTCAMLAAAHAEKRNGRDVVIGCVQTHGRAETAAVIGGLELLPPKSIVYKNRLWPEFDLDAALARRPNLILVDELAHTNFPGCRNRRRWNDIEELLAAGINVWTTMNVHRLESMSEVVHKFTHIRIHHTVPDQKFQDADEIVLVDLSSDELMKRLTDGKIFASTKAYGAKFFKPPSLRALRQLALRCAAEHVSRNLAKPRRTRSVGGAWAAGERILACVGPDALSPLAVRTAKRLANLMQAPWTAVTVECPGRPLDATQRQQIGETIKLAADLGAEVRVLVGNDLPAEILRFSELENVTQIVVGRPHGGIWNELFRRSLPHALARRADDTMIHLVTAQDDPSSWLPEIRPRWRPADLARRMGLRRRNSISTARDGRPGKKRKIRA